MPAPKAIPLILFSGLAADASVFAEQKRCFTQLIVPAWPKPRSDDTLDSYSARLADGIRTGADTIIGGASFGGIIAIHVAQYVQPAAVILIGSVRSPTELPRWIRFCRPLKSLIPLIPVRLLQLCCAPTASQLARRWFPVHCSLARQFRNADPTVFKWSLARILDWDIAPALDCPVFQIHGDRDCILPIRYTNVANKIVGGGHVISLTHSHEVNDFIRFAVTQVSSKQADAPKPPNRAF